ncbi:MAG: hypothetical protein ACI9LM_000564 [Alteromonadaceae bacterium]
MERTSLIIFFLLGRYFQGLSQYHHFIVAVATVSSKKGVRLSPLFSSSFGTHRSCCINRNSKVNLSVFGIATLMVIPYADSTFSSLPKFFIGDVFDFLEIQAKKLLKL